MQFALLRLAPQAIGISTPHYLYLNEAIASAADAGLAEDLVGELSKLSGHRSLVASCHLPKDSAPEDFLFRLTQSSTYHRGLQARPGVAGRVFVSLHRASGVPFTEKLVADPTPLSQFAFYNPMAIDIPRMLDQVEAAKSCYAVFANLPEPADLAANWADIFQPVFHMLLGSLMMLGGIEEKIHQRRRVPSGHLVGWFEQLGSVGEGVKQALAWAQTRVHSLRGGALALAAGGGEPASAIQGAELGELTNIFAGVDRCLDLLSRHLLQWSGSVAQAAGRQVRVVRDEASAPLLRRLAAIMSGEPY